ncbi:MAG: hypothetical protein QM758_13180 [Armatimonas sp.]
MTVEHNAVAERLGPLSGEKELIYSANNYFTIGEFAGLPVVHIQAGHTGYTVMELLADLRGRIDMLCGKSWFLVLVPGILAGLDRADDDDTRVKRSSLQAYTSILTAQGVTLPSDETVRLPSCLTLSAGDKEQNICDIVVAEKILPLTLRHEEKAKIISDALYDVGLINNTLKLSAGEWRKKPGNEGCKVHFGAVAGGYGLIKNLKTREFIVKIKQYVQGQRQPLIAVEMESDAYAILVRNLARQTDRGDIILLFAKAISDWGVAKADDYQKKAVVNSVSFIEHCLNQDIAKNNAVGLSRDEIRKAFKKVSNDRQRIFSNTNLQDWGTPDDSVSIMRVGSMNDNNTVEHWVHRFRSLESDKLRMLIINGPSGRGKTFFARQIESALHAADLDDWHLRWDCGQGPFTQKAICGVLLRSLDSSLQTEFREKFPEVEQKDSPDEGFEDGSALVHWLYEKLFKSGNENRYLYLDDLDRYKSYVSKLGSTLSTFLRLFLNEESTLRVIATSRDSQLDHLIKEAASLLPNLVGETGNASHKDYLRPFTREETEQYLGARLTRASRVRFEDIHADIHVFGGEPLTLRLFADACLQPDSKKKEGESTDSDVDLALRAGREAYEKAKTDSEEKRAEAASRAVRDALFATQFTLMATVSRPLSMALRSVAFLNDEKFSIAELRYESSRLDLMMARTNKLLAKLDPQLELPDDWYSLLTSKGYLREAEVKDAALRMDFDDRARYLISPKSQSDLQMFQLWHEKVAEVYEEERLTSFACWHRMQSGRKLEALWSVMAHTFHWESEERWQELFRLYFRLRELLWNDHDWKWAFVQVKCADILYTAFDNADKTRQLEQADSKTKDQNEWELNLDGKLYLDNLTGNFDVLLDHCPLTIKDMALRVLQDAYLRASLMVAIHAFENYPAIDDESLKPGSKGERQNAAIIKIVDQTIEALHKFKKHPAREAILYNFRGCFHNGCAQFDEATKDYLHATKILLDYKHVIDRYPGSTHTDLLIGFEDDLLDVANNWARTRLLQYGPELALDGRGKMPPALPDSLKEVAAFEIQMERVWATRLAPSSAVNRITFAYALINLIYLKLARADYASARVWINQSYRDNQPPIITPKMPGEEVWRVRDEARRVCDKWVEGYFDVLEEAHLFYASKKTRENADRYIAALESGSERYTYDNFSFSRDEMIVRCNIPLVEIMMASPENRKAFVSDFHAQVERVLKLGSDKEELRTIIDEPIVGDFLCYLYAASESPDGNPINGRDLAAEKLQKFIEEVQGGMERTMIRFPEYVGEGKKFTDEHYILPLLLRGPLQMGNTAHSPHPLALSEDIQQAIESTGS